MTRAHFSGGLLDGQMRQIAGVPDLYVNVIELHDAPPTASLNARPFTTAEHYHLSRSEGGEAWYVFDRVIQRIRAG